MMHVPGLTTTSPTTAMSPWTTKPLPRSATHSLEQFLTVQHALLDQLISQAKKAFAIYGMLSSLELLNMSTGCDFLTVVTSLYSVTGFIFHTNGVGSI